MGYGSWEQHKIFAELRAAGTACSVVEFADGSGWTPFVVAGQIDNLRSDRDSLLEVNSSGQEIRGLGDDVPVLRHLLRRPLEGRQIGFVAAGYQPLSFPEAAVLESRPRAFVGMQFAEPYGTFRQEVIKARREFRV